MGGSKDGGVFLCADFKGRGMLSRNEGGVLGGEGDKSFYFEGEMGGAISLRSDE